MVAITTEDIKNKEWAIQRWIGQEPFSRFTLDELMDDESEVRTRYNIRKSYEGFPSKTNNDYESHTTIEDARNAIDWIAIRWKNNDGSVLEQSEDRVVCEEQDGSNTITFEIFETMF